jgi:hypothetical protein
MGKLSTTGSELAQTVSSAAVTSAAVIGTPIALLGKFNLAIWGVFVGTVVLEKSFDGGATFIQCINRQTQTAVSFTAPAAMSFDEPEPGVLYQLRCSAFTSGTVNGRLSAGVNVAASIDQRLS